jgi:hypothetical protein
MAHAQIQRMWTSITDLEILLERTKKDLKDVISTHPDYEWMDGDNGGPVIIQTPGRGKKLIEDLMKENVELRGKMKMQNVWTAQQDRDREIILRSL